MIGHFQLVLKAIVQRVKQGEFVVCILGLYVCILFVFAQVLNRYLIHVRILWWSNVPLYLFIFFSFISIAMTTWREAHVALHFFQQKICEGKPRTESIYRVCIDAVATGLVPLFVFAAYKFALQALKHPGYDQFLRWFNISWLLYLPLIMSVLVLVHLLIILVRDVDNMRKICGNKSNGI